jgi:hypothetical protein
MAIQKLDEKHVALTLGSLFAAVSAVWAGIVYAGYGQTLLTWMIGVHFVQTQAIVVPFDITTTIVLILAKFIIGALLGYAFAAIWNKLLNKKWAQ